MACGRRISGGRSPAGAASTSSRTEKQPKAVVAAPQSLPAAPPQPQNTIRTLMGTGRKAYVDHSGYSWTPGKYCSTRRQRDSGCPENRRDGGSRPLPGRHSWNRPLHLPRQTGRVRDSLPLCGDLHLQSATSPVAFSIMRD